MFLSKQEPNNGEENNFENPLRNSDGSIKLRNPHINYTCNVHLSHLNLDSQLLELMFSDVKFFCMGGTQTHMKSFSERFQLLMHQSGINCERLSHKSDRCFLDKVGPVLFISHGMGGPSISIFLNEIIQLIYYAKIKDPIVFKIGFCGGLGPPRGTVVVTTDVVDAKMRNYYEVSIFGNTQKIRPAILDQKLVNELYALADLSHTTFGKTMCTSDYFEEQGRIDGAFCEYTKEESKEYLRKLQNLNVMNVEMQSVPFAAITHHAGIRAAILCVVVSDRINEQPTTVREENEWLLRSQDLVIRYILSNYKQAQCGTSQI